MKKILSIFLALAMTASALNVGYADEAAPVDDGAEDIVVSEAAVETDQNISLYSHSSTDTAYTVGSGTFYFDETTGTITDFVPDSSVIFDGIDYLYVPTAINDVDVKRIGKGAFWDACNKYDCHIGGLYINLGNVVQVDSNAFSDCSFDRMIIHAGDIGTDAFKNFDGYLAAYVQGNIGAGAFEGCKNLDITFTNISTQTIGSGAFRNCANMTKITLPSGLTTIGDNAFYGCQSLKTVIIPESVNSIGTNAFENCYSPLTVNCTKGSYADNTALYPEGTIIKYENGLSDILATRVLNVDKNSAIRYNDELNTLRIIPYMEVEYGSTIYIKIKNGSFDESLMRECEYRVPKSGETWDSLINMYALAEDSAFVLQQTLKAANSNKLPYLIRYLDPSTIQVELFPISEKYTGIPNSEVSSGIPTYDIVLPAVAGNEKAEVTIDVDGTGTTIETRKGIVYANIDSYESEQKYAKNSYFEVIDKKTVAPGTKLSDETTVFKFQPIAGIKKDTTLYLNIKNGVFDKNLIESCAYHVPISGQDYDTLYAMLASFGAGQGADDYAAQNILERTVRVANSNEMPYKMEYVDEKTLKIELFPLPEEYVGVDESYVSAGIPGYYFKLPVVTGQTNGDVEIAVDHDNKSPVIRPSGWYAVAAVTGGTAPTTETSTQPTTASQTTTQRQTTQTTTQTTTKAPVTQTTTKAPATQTTTKAPTTQTTTKASVVQTTTQSVTEKPTETTTKAVVTEKPTETTTKRQTSGGSSGGGGGGGKGPAKDNTTTATTAVTTEASTETTTTAKTTGGSKQNDPSDNGTGKTSVISGNVYVTIGKKAVTIDDKEYTIDTAAYIQPESNSTLVPLRFVALAIAGGDIEKADSNENISWDAAAKTATITAGGNVISFTAGSELMTINNNPQIMENGVKAEIKDSRMFIPFRALGRALGVQVDWDAETKTAIYKAK